MSADIADHTYGGNSGLILENTGKSVGNVLRGVTYVGILEGQVLGKTVIKNTAKVNTESYYSENSEGRESINKVRSKEELENEH